MAENEQSPISEIAVSQSEAPLSATARFTDSEGAEWLLTIRSGVTGEMVQSFLQSISKISAFAAKHYGLTPVGKSVRHPAKTQSAAAPTPSNQPPTQQAASAAAPPVARNNGGEDTFDAQLLVADLVGGKPYWSVQGGPFKKFGIRIWPEVLEAAGFDPDSLNVQEQYDLSGYVAHYTENAKGHKKVTMLQKVA